MISSVIRKSLNLKHSIKSAFTKIEPHNSIQYLIIGMGLIYFIAFASLFNQVEGLFGEQGIRPINKTMDIIESRNISFFSIPTIFLLGQSDIMIKCVCGLGALFSLLLSLKILPFISASIVWFCYLSFVTIGQPFLSFQWDILLLEAGFLLLFLVPNKLKLPKHFNVSSWSVIALRMLLFKLLFTSGLVKILSGDSTWTSLTALNFHFFTQPLPHTLSWFFHALPVGIHKIGVLFMLVVELIVPFGLFLSSRIRSWSAWIIIAFMVTIILSGNYTFFNFLVIVLCLPSLKFEKKPTTLQPEFNNSAVMSFKFLIFFLIILLSLSMETNRFIFKKSLDNTLFQSISAFKCINQYGLFSIMTTRRTEISILASIDGKKWEPYRFNYKMNDKFDRPKWVMPHQPRLDWQFWFVALGSYQQSSWWTESLISRLFDKSTAVESLFKSVPFKEQPNFIVLVGRDVTFSSWTKLLKKREWWTVGEQYQFSPVFSRPK